MESDADPCEVCKFDHAINLPESGDWIRQNCPRCGEFKLSRTVSSIMNAGFSPEKRARLSGWIREQYQAGAVPIITSDNLPRILARPIPSVADRATALLVEAESGLSKLGDRFNINDPRFMAATYSSNKDDVTFLLTLLKDQGLAELKEMGGGCEILPAGYIRLDEERKIAPNSSKGFVAMWFNEDLKNVYSSGFEAGIFGAGYDPIRMDRVEHINKIDDEIIKQINGARFIVADFTGHRGGVYFEAGYALGKDIPVFWTCRKDNMGELHFDIRQFNCIDWDAPEELASRLSARIEAVLGPGPKKP